MTTSANGKLVLTLLLCSVIAMGVANAQTLASLSEFHWYQRLRSPFAVSTRRGRKFLRDHVLRGHIRIRHGLPTDYRRHADRPPQL